MTLIDRPVPTEEFGALDSFMPKPDSAFLYAQSGEQRSLHTPEWENERPSVSFHPISGQSLQQFSVDVAGGTHVIGLRSRRRMHELLAALDSDTVYLDITGLPHSTWAPLVQAWLSSHVDLRVVYREPESYTFVESPTEGRLFELSEDFLGVQPLPGFARLAVPEGLATCFVPLLGFEGPRFARLLELLDPARLTVVPVIGVPGFRPDYPYNAALGNRLPLELAHSWPQVRYAKANCPFALLHLLEQVAQEQPAQHFAIGLIGTKPHALGAVLFALRSLIPVELLHDHPIRAAKRTTGTDRVLVYHVSSLEYPGI
jgi:hypothetical protein